MTMTKVTAKATTIAQDQRALLVVFGFDENDKPRAARFEPSKIELVKKAATAMGLHCFVADAEHQLAVARKLPEGKLYAAGKGFVPYVKRELYAKASALFGGEAQFDKSTSPKNPTASLPQDWNKVTKGHLVIAQASAMDGWWEALVIERKHDQLELKWRDYPKYPPFTRHVDCVALIKPGQNAA